VSDCCLTPSESFFSYFMVRTSYILMRWWWCPLYIALSTRWAGFLLC